jgi:hypothetical protein
MKKDLTVDELLAVYGGSDVPYIDGIDGTPLQGQAILAAASGRYPLLLAFDGEINRAVAVEINGVYYDLPGDNPDHPGPY